MLFIPFAGEILPSKDALLIFLGSDEPVWVEIKDVFKEWSEINVVPPSVFVLGTEGVTRRLQESWKNDSNSQAAIDVIRKLSHISLLSYDGNGSVDYVESDVQMPLSSENAVELMKLAVHSFISSEVNDRNVVVAAPPGFYFSKQSDRHSSHFIRTEGLLSCTETIELLALRLANNFRNYCEATRHSTVRVLIDSMVIWPLAHALVALRRTVDSNRRYIVKSFRSYEGFSESRVESGPAFVIISASTSGGLEQQLRGRIGSSHVTCITVLGLVSNKPIQEDPTKIDKNGRCIFLINRDLQGVPSLSGLRTKFETDVTNVPPGWESVRIIGERFLNQNFRPKAVRLAHGSISDSGKQTLAQIASDRLALIARRRPATKSYWSASFNISALVTRYCEDDEQGECLLRSWITNYSVAGDIAIIYPVDILEGGRPGQGEAERLALRIQEILVQRSRSSEVRIFNSSELDTPHAGVIEFMKDAGVIVAAPIIGNGFIFKQISAALRSVQPKGPRLFLTLAVLSESPARLKELQTDLQSNADDRAYNFKHAIALPIGKIDQDIDWSQESEIMSRLVETCGDDNIDIPRRLHDRLLEFRQGNGLGGDLVFFPAYRGGALSMSPGFLLWRTKEAISGTDLGAAVMLTVAVFLEACRSGGARHSDTSLVSGLFQQTLISPANFTRFNDPAIQAALLRTAYRSELNFASSPDLSSDMQRLILRLIRLYDSPAGDALPEFLLALAMQRLTLHQSHLNEVRDAARNLPGWLGILATEIS